MNLLHRAIEWAEFGWPVFPVAWNSKAPAISGGHNRATTKIEQIKSWSWDGNIGIRPPNHTLLVDVDVPAEKKLEDCLAWLKLYDAFEGWIDWRRGLGQWTQGDGYHIAVSLMGSGYPKNSTDIFSTKAVDGSAVDLRSSKGYFVAAPSSIDGRCYRLTENGIVAVENLPIMPRNVAHQLDLSGTANQNSQQNVTSESQNIAGGIAVPDYVKATTNGGHISGLGFSHAKRKVKDAQLVKDALLFSITSQPERYTSYDGWLRGIVFPLTGGVATGELTEEEGKSIYDAACSAAPGNKTDNETQWIANLRNARERVTGDQHVINR